MVGETYTLSCDMQFSGDITWFSPETTRDLIRIGDYRLDFQKNKNLNHYETEFVYSEGLSFEFLFYAIQDNKLFTATFTNFTIEGEMIGDKIIDIYNKRVGRWIKYTPPEMIGATSKVDGQSGIVPKPTISDKDKFLKGDGTWGEAGGGTEVSITPSLQSGTKIADYEIDGVTGELYAPRGSGGSIVDHNSTEQVVGTWFGKPLYRRSYQFTTSNLPANRYAFDQILHLDQLVKVEGAYNWLNFQDATHIDIRCFVLGEAPPQTNSKAIWLLVEQTDSSDLTASSFDVNFNFNGKDRSKILKLCASVEYTKTTDV